MASKNPSGHSGRGSASSKGYHKSSDKGSASSKVDSQNKGGKSTKDAYNQKKYKSSPSVSAEEDDKKYLHQLRATSKSDGNANSSNPSRKNLPNSVAKHQSNATFVASKPSKNPNQPVSTSKTNVKQGPTKVKINVYDIKNERGSANSVHLKSPQSMSIPVKEHDVKSTFNKTLPKCFQSNPQNISRHPGPRIQTHRPQGNVMPSRNLFQIANRFQQPQRNLPSQYRHGIRFQQTHPNSNKKTFNFQKNLPFTNPSDTLGNKALFFSNQIQNSQSHSVLHNQHRFENQNDNITTVQNLNTVPRIKYRKNVERCSNLKQSKKMQNNNSNPKKKGKRLKKNNLPPKAKEPEKDNATPLLCFTKKTIEPEDCNLMQFSDDDSLNLSQNSFDGSNVQNFNLIDFSDENDLPIGPLQSVDCSYSQDLINFSVEDSDSDSSYDSDESEAVSEVSEISSIISSEINAQNLNATKEAFISVFWDIENCKIPVRKSAVDFANYVRDTFYEGRTEVTFTAACDVSYLNDMVVRELDEASVTLIHISSSNKNAADKKLMSHLQRFQMQYQKTNSAIVLISSDSDFSPILRDMRYKHHIFINLICNINTRQSLITAADKCELFEDIINKLPDRNIKDNMQHVLLITNLPKLQPKSIKSNLSEKLKSFNCRIKFTNNTSAIEVIFKDHSVCEKAAAFLKGYYFGGKLLEVTYSSKLGDKTTVLKKRKKDSAQSKISKALTSDPFSSLLNAPESDPFSSLVNAPAIDPFNSLVNAPAIDPFSSLVNAPAIDPFSSLVNAPAIDPFSSLVNTPASDPLNSLVNVSESDALSSLLNASKNDTFSFVNTPKNDSHSSVANASKSDPFNTVDEKSSGKGAALCVFVSMNFGNVDYWKIKFEEIWNASDFSLQWEGSSFYGYFLIHFKSLKKAQKAKKVLEKNHLNDQNAPRFFKLIKHDDDLCSLTINDVEESNKRKMAEHVQIIEKRKLKYLRSHENIMKKIKSQTASSVQGTSEAVDDKLNEYKEQMEIFIRFSKHIVEQIKKLNCKSENLEPELNELLCDFTRECNCISSALPIYAKKDLILKKVQEHQVVIIRAETGSGKSTQLTQYLWRERNSFGNGKIICTQPRKIAAVSLAKYVSTQIGSKLGGIVGYQVGMSSKMSENTGVLYVTDFTMLNLLIQAGLSDVSCVIIDEAHERTIYTDILLGMIKKCLPSCPHVKIIITSATIDTSIFRDYFNLTESSVLQISGRMFPVEDVWFEHDVKPDWDYFSKTIDTALEILSEGPGDILSFLVTPLETEKACESFNEKLKGKTYSKNVKVFNLHGRLNPEEQQKIFEKLPEGMKKVVFATNCAETSITIPGIRYVIDCGLVKESQYDATRNMNVLTVGFVSKSSAKQRRGRAGRTQVGKCYHLYSKVNHELMVESTDPEILRINLGEALLKLMKMGISDPVQFDFVQSPPVDLLKSAMEQLLYLKAVDESSFLLTDLGKKMAALPLEPRLSHLILKGLDNNIEYEALTVAALITVSNTIFFRTSENKDKADKLKRRFCESENDYLTFLNVYKEWVDIPKSKKAQWCVMNCINARSMKVAHDLIHEIILTLQKELSYKVKTKFKDNSNDTLLTVIFHSFSQNLAVFSGHSKFGYKSSSLSDRLLIYPGSSVSVFYQSTPQYVIYGTILKTSQTFMINVCPVTRSMILEAISTHDLKIDLQSLEDMIASVYCISPLGCSVIVNNFIGKKGVKRKELINKLEVLSNSNFVEVDISVPKGLVQIIGYGIKNSEIEAVVSPIIDAAQQKLLMQETDVCLLKDSSEFTAILTAGGYFKDVVLPGEFRDVKVILKEDEDIESVAEKLSTCGLITKIHEWKTYFKITFEFPSSAQKALETYTNESGFSLKRIEKNISGIRHNYRVFISFLRRKCTGCAFITLDESASVNGILPPTICYRSLLVKISRSRKTNDICLYNLPADTDKKDLEPVVVSAFPAGTKIKKFIIARLKPYDSSQDEIDLLRVKIYNLFAEFTHKENIQVVLKKPLPKDFTWNATVYFTNALEGETSVSVLRNRKTHANFIGSIMLEPTIQTYLYCKPEIFSAVKVEIEEALQFFKNDLSAERSLEIIAVPKGTDRVEIKITSNNVSDLTDARRSIYAIIRGDEIKFPNDSDKEKLFTDLGKTYLKKLSKETEDCYIFQNIYSKTITVFGKVNACNVIKMQINSFLEARENEEYKDISLKTESGNSVLKEMYKIYGFDFQKLKEEFDITDIQVNKYKQILTIQGTFSSVSKCEIIIQEIKKKLNTNCPEAVEESCPVCYDEVSEVNHRLEYCGHSYCVDCLLHLLQSSGDIPLKCEKIVEDSSVCNAPIVVADLIWAFNGRENLEKSLHEKFLHSFVENRDDISFCPSPDCPMIYRVTKDKMNIFKCPACNNDICTRCEELYHSGISCFMHQYLKSNEDFSLEVWMKEDPCNRKKCPSCSVPIEKNGGCNHMICWKCKCHMCWLCLQVFPTSDLTYSHQPYCPVGQLHSTDY